MQNVLITGITGFAGSHLAEFLVKGNKYKVFGTHFSDKGINNISSIKDSVNLVKINLEDCEQVVKLIGYSKPDIVFHLAALTSPGDSFKHPVETVVNNTTIQINLLEAILKAGADPKILITSSADIYGKVKKEDLPIDEETSLNPTNPYSVSKITQDFLGLQYFLSYNLKVIRVRPFNHVGPRQSSNFVVSSFAKQIAQIEKKKIEPILKVGNLDSKRDFTDVRDMVRAYDLIINRGDLGDVYNIGSGKSCKISEILDNLLRLSDAEIRIEKDEGRIRPGDTPELLADISKIKNKTGWIPEITIDKTLKETLDYWRNIV